MYKTVVAIRAGYHDARRIKPGTVFEVPKKMKGSWFVDHKPGAPIPVEAAKEPDPFAGQALQRGQTAQTGGPPATLGDAAPPQDQEPLA